jgi:serine/threonine-protein kinase
MALGTKIPHFTLVRELGSAGATQLFLARQEGLEREAVVRVLRRDQLGIGADELRQFEEEGRLLARIQHQGVVRVYQIGDTGEGLYRAMEYLGGGSLLKPKGRGPLTPRQAVGCCAQVAAALNALQKAGVFQRSLFPSRIRFRDNGLPVLTDLGAVGGMATVAASDAAKLKSGVPGYCSPEVLGCTAPDARSDVFALGLMLHSMLT